MDFFKSVFSDDPDPPKPEPAQSDDASQSRETRDHQDLNRHSFQHDNESHRFPDAEEDSSITSAGWSFGGLIRTLTSKSESVVEIYRRDLQEFGSGLRKELQVAQGSLGTVGNTIDEIGNSVLEGTARMIAQGRDAILAVDHESDSDHSSSGQNLGGQRNLISKGYSRFDAQVRIIQNDVSTYSLEPEHLDDYSKWRSEFSLDEKSDQIKNFLDDNDAMLNIHKELVPNRIDSETFWSRYYYKVFKLKQAEELRAKLAKRSISKEEEDEELSWDVDDDADQEEEEKKVVEEQQDAGRSPNINCDDTGAQGSVIDKGNSSGGESTSERRENLTGNKIPENESGANHNNENSTADSKTGISMADEKVDTDGRTNGGIVEGSAKKGLNSERNDELSKNVAATESTENLPLKRTDDLFESKTEDKEFSMVSTKPSTSEEEDLEWDEIEDLSSLDDKKSIKSGSPNRADLRKRLSAAEEDDLSWDIEDDDD